jgi:hypothetical protein
MLLKGPTIRSKDEICNGEYKTHWKWPKIISSHGFKVSRILTFSWAYPQGVWSLFKVRLVLYWGLEILFFELRFRTAILSIPNSPIMHWRREITFTPQKTNTRTKAQIPTDPCFKDSPTWSDKNMHSSTYLDPVEEQRIRLVCWNGHVLHLGHVSGLPSVE